MLRWLRENGNAGRRLRHSRGNCGGGQETPEERQGAERLPGRAVAEREAADWFLASELAVLRIMEMSSESPVPARLYLGIEECFAKSVAIA